MTYLSRVTATVRKMEPEQGIKGAYTNYVLTLTIKAGVEPRLDNAFGLY